MSETVKFSTYRNEITVQRFGGANTELLKAMLGDVRTALNDLNNAWMSDRFYSMRRKVEEMRQCRDRGIYAMHLLQRADVVTVVDMVKVCNEIRAAYHGAYSRRQTVMKNN